MVSFAKYTIPKEPSEIGYNTLYLYGYFFGLANILQLKII